MAKTSKIDQVLAPRAAQARRRFEVPVLVAALLVVPVIFIEERATSPELLNLAYWANWAIWAVFTAEYLTVVTRTDRVKKPGQEGGPIETMRRSSAANR